MNKAIEMFVRYSEAKSLNLNQSEHGRIYNDSIARVEFHTALDFTNREHNLGMLIIKSMYIDSDIYSKEKLLNEVKKYCLFKGMTFVDIISYIIVQIILNKPLVTQHQKIKLLYKKFGFEAKKINKQQAKIQNELNELYENTYRKEQLESIFKSNKKKLDKYADEVAKTTIRCPQCITLIQECKFCCKGQIKATIEDVLKLFIMFEANFDSTHFLTQYWTPILSIINDLEILKMDAENKMYIELQEINSVL